jgi:two-component system chemotaxis response regulator CheY
MSKKILVIDDSESIRELVSMVLENGGYAVDRGSDGLSALKLLDGRKVDLIITDLNMPNVDGISLIREVRKMNQYTTTPILILTTESQTALKEEAKAAGATGWVIKPFAGEKLLAVINKVIK